MAAERARTSVHKFAIPEILRTRGPKVDRNLSHFTVYSNVPRRAVCEPLEALVDARCRRLICLIANGGLLLSRSRCFVSLFSTGCKCYRDEEQWRVSE